MAKGVFYLDNANTQTSVPVNGLVNFGTIVRRKGCGFDASGSTIVVKGIDYYNVEAYLTVTGVAADEVTLSLYKDGIPIQGANATFTTTVGGVLSVALGGTFRIQNCMSSQITLVVSGGAITVNNVGVVITRE